jgi:hypothetical protein
MPDSDDSDAQGVGDDNEHVAGPTVRDLLLDRIDEHCRMLALRAHARPLDEPEP